MKDAKQLVLKVIKTVVLKKNKTHVVPEAKLREDLGIDSIKMIAIAAMLKEEGCDVITGGNTNDFAAIETVQDVIKIAEEIISCSV